MNGPGPFWRADSTGETARRAAELQRPKAPAMREVVAAFFEDGPHSPDMIWAKLQARGEPMVLQTVRSRVNELRLLGRVVATDERAPASGPRFKAIVWRKTDEAERLAILAAREVVDE